MEAGLSRQRCRVVTTVHVTDREVRFERCCSAGDSCSAARIRARHVGALQIAASSGQWSSALVGAFISLATLPVASAAVADTRTAKWPATVVMPIPQHAQSVIGPDSGGPENGTRVLPRERQGRRS